MAPARFERVEVELATAAGDIALAASGSATAFDGFLRLYRESSDDSGAVDDDRDRALPELREGETIMTGSYLPIASSVGRRLSLAGGSISISFWEMVRLHSGKSTASSAVPIRNLRFGRGARARWPDLGERRCTMRAWQSASGNAICVRILKLRQRGGSCC